MLSVEESEISGKYILYDFEGTLETCPHSLDSIFASREQYLRVQRGRLHVKTLSGGGGGGERYKDYPPG